MGDKEETKMVKDEENNEKEKEEEEETTPIRPIYCLKNRSETQMKKLEEIDDCFILDFDPFLSLSYRLPVLSLADDDVDDLCVIAIKGQVACRDRDYPHSMHPCVKFPFETTPHETCCELCYCYVCDSPAPCKYWTSLDSYHCHASEHVGDWKSLRNSWKNQHRPSSSPSLPRWLHPIHNNSRNSLAESWGLGYTAL